MIRCFYHKAETVNFFNSRLGEQAGTAPFKTMRSPETFQFTPHFQNIFPCHLV
jgi:hypothetical protein